MFTLANWVRELWQPRLEPCDHRRLEGLERGRQRRRVRRSRFAQFGAKLQEPGQAVRAFERLASGAVQVGHFAGNTSRSEVHLEGSEGIGRERRSGKRADQARQQPVTMH